MPENTLSVHFYKPSSQNGFGQIQDVSGIFLDYYSFDYTILIIKRFTIYFTTKVSMLPSAARGMVYLIIGMELDF
jgi:hypothetical protein